MTKVKPYKKIIDAITGEEIIIELTAEEIAENERIDAQIAADELATENARKEAEVKKQIILTKLGLTSDEVISLLT